MEEFSRITVDEFNRIYAKTEKITSADRMKLQSFSVLPLCNRCEKLTNSEMQEVYYLENKNLSRVINIAMILSGKNIEGLKLLQSTNIYILCLEECQSSYQDEKFKTRVFITLMFKLCLKDLNIKGRIEFDGKMPQKLFQFRQQTADQWFAEYTEAAINAFGLIYTYLGADEAFAFILAYTAYYLNRSQTFKYYALSSDRDMNDTIYRVLMSFYDNLDGNSTEKSNVKNFLYKNL